MGERDGGGGGGAKTKRKMGLPQNTGPSWLGGLVFVCSPGIGLDGSRRCVCVVWCFMVCFVFVHGAIM